MHFGNVFKEYFSLEALVTFSNTPWIWYLSSVTWFMVSTPHYSCGETIPSEQKIVCFLLFTLLHLSIRWQIFFSVLCFPVYLCDFSVLCFPFCCVTQQKSQGNWGVRKRQSGKKSAGYVLCVTQSDSARDWGSTLSLDWEYYALSLSHVAVKGRQQEKTCW